MVFVKCNNLKYGDGDKTYSQDLSTQNNVMKFSQIFRQPISGLGSNYINTIHQQYAAEEQNYGK